MNAVLDTTVFKFYLQSKIPVPHRGGSFEELQVHNGWWALRKKRWVKKDVSAGVFLDGPPGGRQQCHLSSTSHGHTGYRQNLRPERTLCRKKHATNAYAIIWYEIRQRLFKPLIR
jgi:hypothetical protein